MDAPTPATATSHDFRLPSRLPHYLERLVLDWQYAACRLVPEKFSRHLSIPAALGVRPPDSLRAADIEIAPEEIVFEIAVEGIHSPTVMYLAGPLGAILAQSLVGESLESLPQPRRLTKLEIPILEIAIAQVLEGLNEAALGLEMPACQSKGHIHQPHVLRIFPGADDFIRLRFDFKCPLGDLPWYWIWPAEALKERFPDTPLEPVKIQQSNSELREVAQRMPLDLRVKLGSAKIPVAELAALSVGDVIVLDQRVNAPLDCLVEDQILLRGWPGVQGGRQVVQVAGMG